MGELFFVLKSFGIAMLLLAALQFKVGGETIETKGIRWIETSQVGAHLKDVAEGAIKVSEKAWDQAMTAIGAKSTKSVGFHDWKVEFKHKSEEKAER